MRSLLVAVLLAAALAEPARAFLCTRTPGLGPSVAWSQRRIVLHRYGRGVEVDEAAFDAVLARSAGAWSDVACSDMELELGAPTRSRLVGFDWHKGSDDPDNENIVLFKGDDPDDPLDAWLHTFGALAITTVTFDTTTGRLVDADVEINDVSFGFTTCDPGDAGCVVDFDLENTMTHELGHVVGLDHPPLSDPGAAEATMFASAPRGDTAKRTLSSDDEAGLCTLYPAGETTPGECFGVGRPGPANVRFEQTSCAMVGAEPLAWLLSGLLLRLTHPRRKRDGGHRDRVT